MGHALAVQQVAQRDLVQGAQHLGHGHRARQNGRAAQKALFTLQAVTSLFWIRTCAIFCGGAASPTPRAVNRRVRQLVRRGGVLPLLHSILSLGAGGSTKMVDIRRDDRIDRVFHPKYPTE